MRKYNFDPLKDAQENLSDSARLSHVRGNPDDYADWNEQDRIELSKPYGYFYDDEEAERKFREIIASHAERWKSWTLAERTPAFYAHKYFSLFEDIYRLMERSPHWKTDKEYDAMLRASDRYEQRENFLLGLPDPYQWRNI